VILNVAAPGVLANDGLGLMGGLVTTLVTGPTNGTLIFGTNGGFSYSPSPGFLGNDLFTYQVIDAQSNSSTATVSGRSGPVGAMVGSPAFRELVRHRRLDEGRHE
jgi:hypothetical protein